MQNRLRALAVVAVILTLPQLLPGQARADWQALGTRWAVVRDTHGTAVEIDDLTYPGPLGRSILGHLAPIKKTARVGQESVDWWRTIPWKSPRMLDGEPTSFGFEDVDFARVARDPARFAAINEQWNRGIMPEFLTNFRFERSADGGYEMIWAPRGPAKAGPPLRVVTLRSIPSNLWRTLGHQVLENGLALAVDLIPIPVLQGLLQTALDRFFHWNDLLASTREEALAEMLSDPPADFALSASERERAAEGLLYAETNLLDSPRWLWQRPGKNWAKRLTKEKYATQASRAWLGKAGIYTQPLSAHFDWQPPLGSFYLSGAGFSWGHELAGPILGLDSGRPDAIFERRVGIESTVSAAIFLSSWVPYIGGLQIEALKALVEFPEDHLRGWEARLGARLEDRETRLGENWEPELEKLVSQQENPFEGSHAQSVARVAERRAALGLPPLP